MVDIQFPTTENMRRTKKERKKLQLQNIMSASATQGGRNNAWIIDSAMAPSLTMSRVSHTKVHFWIWDHHSEFCPTVILVFFNQCYNYAVNRQTSMPLKLQLVKQHGLHPHCYADDTQIYGFCDLSDVDTLQERLSDCIDEVFGIPLFWQPLFRQPLFR